MGSCASVKESNVNRLIELRTPDPVNIYKEDIIEGCVSIKLQSKPCEIYMDGIVNRLVESDIMSELNSIFYMSPERAEVLYAMGYRTIDDLLSRIDTIELQRAEYIGIRYNKFLIIEIDKEHENAWLRVMTIDLLMKFRSPVVSFVVRSRDHGNHSRIEVLVETYDTHNDEMVNVVGEYCKDVIIEDETVSLQTDDMLTRYKCIGRLGSYNPVILDITIYNSIIEPYPKFRECKGDLENIGVIMTDTGIEGEEGLSVRSWLRLNTGSDKPKSLNALLEALDNVRRIV